MCLCYYCNIGIWFLKTAFEFENDLDVMVTNEWDIDDVVDLEVELKCTLDKIDIFQGNWKKVEETDTCLKKQIVEG